MAVVSVVSSQCVVVVVVVLLCHCHNVHSNVIVGTTINCIYCISAVTHVPFQSNVNVFLYIFING